LAIDPGNRVFGRWTFRAPPQRGSFLWKWNNDAAN
jgi:hypothetical protein